jgi:purine-cytosine permease-like protein
MGTFWGYLVGNAWFYALGALLVLGAGLSDTSPAGLAQGMASLAGGWIVLLVLLAGETDEAFADIYSSAVSSQNLAERIPQRAAVLVAAVLGAALATWLGLRPSVALGTFESFLFLLGSVFVPLFGVFVARHLPRRRVAAPTSVRWSAMAAWTAGFLVYQWSVPTGPAVWQSWMATLFHDWLHLPFPLWGSVLGASVPAFGVALLLDLAFRRAERTVVSR